MKLFVRDKKFYLTALSVGLPVVFQSLITSGVNLADTMMVLACGELQLTAVSLANQFVSFYQVICMGLGFGVAVLTAQYWGAKDLFSLRRVTTIMLRICLSLALMFSVLAFLLPSQIMNIYTPDADVAECGAKYLRICAFTYVFHGLAMTITAVLRSVRQVKLPLVSSIIAFFVNIFANWVFIFGHLGVPAMGVEGAALGTLIARMVEAGIITIYFLFIDKRIVYRFRDFFIPCGSYLKTYCHYSLPVVISDVLLGLGNNMVSIIMGHIGGGYMAAVAVVNQVTSITSVLTQGVSSSASIITGNTLGTGDKKKAYEQGKTFWALAFLVGVFASLVILLIRPFILSTQNLSPDTLVIVGQLLYTVNFTVIVSSTESVMSRGILRGGGDTKFLMVMDIIFLWTLSIPLGYLTGRVWKCPAPIIYLSLRAHWFVTLVMYTIRLFRGKWMRTAAQDSAK